MHSIAVIVLYVNNYSHVDTQRKKRTKPHQYMVGLIRVLFINE